MTPFNESMRYDYDLGKVSMVWDCGGYRGDFAARIFDKYGCRVIVFEPVAQFADIIRERFKDNTQIAVLRAGIGGMSRLGNFFVRNDSSGLYCESGKIVESEIAGITDILESLPPSLRTEKIDLIKLNVEGSEFCTLESMTENGLQTRFQNIQVQWHPVVYDCEKRYDALQKCLSHTHELTFDNGWTWQNWRVKP